jgi:hypothetical protein
VCVLPGDFVRRWCEQLAVLSGEWGQVEVDLETATQAQC